MKLTKQIGVLKEKLNSLKSAYDERLESIQRDLIKLTTESEIITNNWAGSWFEHTDIYHDFMGNQKRHIQLSYEEFWIFQKTKLMLILKKIGKK